MTNPILVEVTRGAMVESRHCGRVAVVDGDGKVVFSQGDIDGLIYPRSSCKAMQALFLVESGAADAYGFTNREIALASASHTGEPAHISLAASMLAAAGRDVASLECGAHWSWVESVLIEQARTLDHPTALHNTCSGKHAGFVCAACHLGQDPLGYAGYDHPVQQEIRSIMQALTGSRHDENNSATDGCSIPTYAIPLKSLAHGFAKMATGVGLSPQRARAAQRIMDACMAEPFYVSGTKGDSIRLMGAAPGRIFAKSGAEGVFCAAIPEQGIAIALKSDDGAPRAAESMIAATLARFFSNDAEVHARLMLIADHAMHNWNKIHVGNVRATSVFDL